MCFSSTSIIPKAQLYQHLYFHLVCQEFTCPLHVANLDNGSFIQQHLTWIMCSLCFFKKYDKQFWLQDWKLIMCTETCLTRGTCQEGEEWTLICIMVRSGLVIQEGMRRLDEDQHLADCHPLTHHTQCHCFSSRPGPATRCRSAQCTSHQLSSRGAEALSSPTRHSLKYLFTIITVVVLPAVILNGTALLEELVRECTFQIRLGVHALLGHTRLWTQKRTLL